MGEDMRVAVFGAAGFLGRAVVARLKRDDIRVRAITRVGDRVDRADENVASGDLLTAPLPPLVEGCDAVINCAARVHVLRREDPAAADAAFAAMNTDFAVRLGQAAKAATVRRFVQLSSVAAIGSVTPAGTTADDAITPRPDTAYGRSKLAADQALQRLNSEQFVVVSLRPPTIHGPAVGALFARLDRAARYGVPLPLAGIDNRRSIAFVDNIADAVACAARFGPAGSYLVSDSEPLSSAALYRMLLRLHGHGDRAFALPKAIVWAAARMILRKRATSLLGSCAIDGGRFATAFGWQPVIPLDLALSRTISGAG